MSEGRDVNKGLIWWLRNDPRGRRDWRFRICVFAVWLGMWALGLFPGVWVLPVIVALHVGDLLLSYYWWRRDLAKAEANAAEGQQE